MLALTDFLKTTKLVDYKFLNLSEADVLFITTVS